MKWGQQPYWLELLVSPFTQCSLYSSFTRMRLAVKARTLLPERTDLIWGRGQKPTPSSVARKMNKLGRKQRKSHSSWAWGGNCGWDEWKISGPAINLTRRSGNERTTEGLHKLSSQPQMTERCTHREEPGFPCVSHQNGSKYTRGGATGMSRK